MSIPVRAYGLGLVKAVVDQTSDFYVDTKGLRGSLTVQVNGKYSVFHKIRTPLYFCNNLSLCGPISASVIANCFSDN